MSLVEVGTKTVPREHDFDARGTLKMPDYSRQGREFRDLLQPSKETPHHGLMLLNTRHFMHEQKEERGEDFTIDKVSQKEWQDTLKGYDTVWFMGIYEPSPSGQQLAKKYSYQYEGVYPDLNPEEDVVASPFAIPEYKPNPLIVPDWESWDTMVDKVHGLGKKVMVDFVPNHTAVDHPWAKEHPEYYIQGSQSQYDANPQMYVPVTAEDGKKYYLAHGKDPNYPEWADTLQLNYAEDEVQDVMKNTLLELTKHADGVRCDMAMLPNAGTFLRTWSTHLSEDQQQYIRENDFWGKTIPDVKEAAKKQGKDDFTFMAEAYWDKEKLGDTFDYIYNKELYDHLKGYMYSGSDKGVFDEIKSHVSYLLGAKERKYHDANFVENHDEEPALAVFGESSKAMAALTGILPDSVFLVNDGQPRGRVMRPPMQVNRPPTDEPGNPDMEAFYDRLMQLKQTKLFQDGEYTVLNPETADNILAIQVEDKEKPGTKAVVCINMDGRKDRSVGVIDEIGKGQNVDVFDLTYGGFVDNADTTHERGMYVELAPWETQVFFVSDKQPRPLTSVPQK